MGGLLILYPSNFLNFQVYWQAWDACYKDVVSRCQQLTVFFFKAWFWRSAEGPISAPSPWSKLRGLISALPLPPLRPEQHVAPNMTFFEVWFWGSAEWPYPSTFSLPFSVILKFSWEWFWSSAEGLYVCPPPPSTSSAQLRCPMSFPGLVSCV